MEALQLNEVIEDWNRMLATSDQNTRQDRMGCSAFAGAVAAVGFPCNHRGAQHAFGLVVGSVERVHVQETQQMRPMFSQALGETGVIGVGQPALCTHQSIQARLEGLSLREVTEWIPTAFFRLQGQGFLQDLGRFPSKAQRPAGFAFLHLFQIVQQVADTFLFQPGPKSLFVVSQIAIRRQDAFELSAQDIDHHVAAAIVPNGVDADFPIGEDPEPSRQGANSPTGLIRVHHTAQPNELDQLFIHRSGGLGQLLICLTPPAAAHRQSEGVV